jgi:hypothetical protein
MGAGVWSAGAIPAGFEIGNRTSSPLPPGEAAAYDPLLRVIVVDADGLVAVTHYVDQQTVFALSIPLGSIASLPNLGLDVRSILKASQAAAALTTQAAVRRAVASLLKGSSIVLGTIVFEQNYAAGRRSFQVPYQNLVAPAPQGRIAQVKIG